MKERSSALSEWLPEGFCSKLLSRRSEATTDLFWFFALGIFPPGI
jgi:hypothetical protein